MVSFIQMIIVFFTQGIKLIFFIYPVPKGSEENQFASASWRIWGKQIDFLNLAINLGK